MAIYYQTPPPFTGGHQPDAGPLGPVITSATINNPPFGLITPEYPVYFAWIPDPPSVLYSIKLAQEAQIDFAPFGRRDWRQTARVDAWIADAPLISYPTKLAQSATVDSPIGRAPDLSAIVAAWQAVVLPQPARSLLIQPGAAATPQLPYNRYGLIEILQAWIVAAPATQRSLSVIQAAQIDAPIGGTRDLSGVLQAWIQNAPPIAIRALLVQSVIAAATQVPYSRAALIEILQAWQAAPFSPPQPPPKIPQAATIDAPPFGLRDYVSIATNWQPIPVTPLRRVMLAASGAVILTPTAAVLTSIQFSAALAGDLKLAAMLQAVINFEAGQ